jgi:hypothetical protein
MGITSPDLLFYWVLTEKYPDFIYQIVSDSKRSWHAGVSTWGNDSGMVFRHNLVSKTVVKLRKNRLMCQSIPALKKSQILYAFYI